MRQVFSPLLNRWMDVGNLTHVEAARECYFASGFTGPKDILTRDKSTPDVQFKHTVYHAVQLSDMGDYEAVSEELIQALRDCVEGGDDE